MCDIDQCNSRAVVYMVSQSHKQTHFRHVLGCLYACATGLSSSLAGVSTSRCNKQHHPDATVCQQEARTVLRRRVCQHTCCNKPNPTHQPNPHMRVCLKPPFVHESWPSGQPTKQQLHTSALVCWSRICLTCGHAQTLVQRYASRTKEREARSFVLPKHKHTHPTHMNTISTQQQRAAPSCHNSTHNPSSCHICVGA